MKIYPIRVVFKRFYRLKDVRKLKIRITKI